MTELTVITYPWDVAIRGVEAFVDEIASLGANRVAICTSYHSAEVISPRRREAVVYEAEANKMHMAFPDGAFSDLRIPPSSLVNDHPSLYEDLASECFRAGLGLTGWSIAFHNSTLASQFPDAAIQNCFGDRLTHGLCPANPRSRKLLTDLVDAVIGRGHFDRLLMESISYLLVGHGHPHELYGVRLDPTCRYLVSLCFCVYCTEAAQARGIDAERLRAWVRDELIRTWNSPLATIRSDGDGGELASLLLSIPDLAAWTRLRSDIVSELVDDVRRRTNRAEIGLELTSAVWARPSHLNWMQGVNVIHCADAADKFLLTAYYTDISDVVSEIDHTLSLVKPAQLTLSLTLWAQHHGSADGLLAKIRAAQSVGIESFGLYNYGTATEVTLDWIRLAAREIGLA